MFVRRLAAVLAGRFVGWLSRLVRIGGGTAVSGLVSITIDPSFVVVNLRGLASSVAITGTNGKTTTTAVLSHLLETDGRAVLSNPTGSNLERGLAAAMLPRLTWDGRTRGFKDLHGVFEVDEAAFAALMPDSSPTIAVFLNLFRDQLDRYGEVDHTALLDGQPQPCFEKEQESFALYRIGDAVANRNIHAAIYDALRLMKDI